MIRIGKLLLSSVAAIALVSCTGCGGARVTVPLALDGTAGTFEVTAGEPVAKALSGDLSNSGITVGSGDLLLNANDISFTPADNGGGKGTVNYQGGGVFTVSGGIAAGADVATVCDAPVDSYGPFTVTLDADFNVESIDPPSINLEQSTIDLINSGAISICLTVESNVDGTLVIDELTFSLGL